MGGNGIRRATAASVLAACILAGALVPASNAQTASPGLIDNGIVKLGVNDLGHLNREGFGVHYLPTGNDSTFPGCPCEGWGVADASTGITGYANESAGTDGLTLESFVTTASTAVSTVTIAGPDTSPAIRVTHDYHPAEATPNLYQATVTIENLTAATLSDIRYRRVMDWDVEPTPFDEFVTIDGSASSALLYSSDGGFSSANPLAPRQIEMVEGPPVAASFTDSGPEDHGALFDFGFGELAAAETFTFNIYYGAAGTEEEALAAVSDVGAELWSFGQPNTPDGPDEDTLADGPEQGKPNTFIFAFGGVGGTSFAGGDRRPPVNLDFFAPGSVGGSTEFDVTARLHNVGTGPATDVTVALDPGTATLVSGANPGTFATIGAGQVREHTWTLRAPPACGDTTFTLEVTADYAERSEAESPRVVTHTATASGGSCDVPPPGDPENAEGDVPPGGSLSTDLDNDGATPDDQVETTVISPQGGPITIQETTPTQDIGSEWTAVGQQINIEAPPATTHQPLQLIFRYDASLIPADQNEHTIEIFRNGQQVGPCNSPQLVAAVPDPCIAQRERLGDGDVRITVYTSHASAWNAGLRPPRQVGGGAGPTVSPSASASPTQSVSPSPTATVTATVTASPSASASPSGSQSPGTVDTTPPVVEAFANTGVISPNADGRSDELIVSATFSENVTWRFEVTPAGQARQAGTTASYTQTGTGTTASIRWAGQGTTSVVPDGDYRWQVTAVDTAGNAATPDTGLVTVDRAAPEAEIDLPRTRARAGKSVAVVVTVDEGARVTVKIVRKGKTIARFNPKLVADAGDLRFKWDGLDRKGRRVAPGRYTVKAVAVDEAGNKGTAKAALKVR